MEMDFLNVVKAKTNEQLVHIVINKEEYKDEMVQAATNELRSRSKKAASIKIARTTSFLKVKGGKRPLLFIWLAYYISYRRH